MERLGKYRILRRLGQGAMGAVYLAEHSLLKVSRALKVLPEELSSSGTFQERFLIEGRVLARLQHPRIVQVHDMDVEDGVYYIAMDFISPDGKRSWSLDTLLKRSGGRMSPGGATRVLRQVCEAIAYAHDAGVVHCDIKPGNILIAGDNDVRVSDFGLSKVVGWPYLDKSIKASLSGSLGMERTRPPGERREGPGDSLGLQGTMDEREKANGSVVGTFHYMPPEVQEGGEWTPRGDLYSIGVLTYVLLTGKRPVGRWKEPSRVVDGLSPAWDDLVETLLADDPAERPVNAVKLMDMLHKIDKDRTPGKTGSRDLPDKEEMSEGNTKKSSGKPFRKVLVAAVLGLVVFAVFRYGLPMGNEKPAGIGNVPEHVEASRSSQNPAIDPGSVQSSKESEEQIVQPPPATAGGEAQKPVGTEDKKPVAQVLPEITPPSPTVVEANMPAASSQVPDTAPVTVTTKADTGAKSVRGEASWTEGETQKETSVPDATGFSQTDMQQMEYWAGVAEIQYGEAASWRTRLREGSDKWNARVNENIAAAQQNADQAFQAWLAIREKYTVEETEEEAAQVWLEAVENAGLRRSEAEALQKMQQNTNALASYETLDAQRKEQRAMEDAAKIFNEQQRKINYQMEMEAFNEAQAMKQEEIRRRFSK